MAEDIIKVKDLDDPRRCQASTVQGQCYNLAVDNGNNCAAHGGCTQARAVEAKSIRNYRVAKFQVALDRHSDSPRLKNLNEEVGILRMMLEEQLEQCDDVKDLVIKSHLISDLVMKIEKLVKSCHTLEASLGGLMDKTAILTFATKVIDVITAELDDEVILAKVSNGILRVVGEMGQNEQ